MSRLSVESPKSDELDASSSTATHYVSVGSKLGRSPYPKAAARCFPSKGPPFDPRLPLHNQIIDLLKGYGNKSSQSRGLRHI
jgi:hypothetical protein